MNEVMILRRGGGSKLSAAIGVTYPAESTCICTNGTKTLVSKATNGQWVFPIPKEGKWTVLAGDKSREVEINSLGQCVVINLKETVLFDRANSSGWVSMVNVTGKGSAEVSDGVMSINGAMDYDGHAEYYTFLRYYSTRVDITSEGSALRINATSFTENAKLVAFTNPAKVCPGILNDPSITYFTADVLKSQPITAAGATLELPVGNYYVGVLVDGTGQVSTSKVWIE